MRQKENLGAKLRLKKYFEHIHSIQFNRLYISNQVNSEEGERIYFLLEE